MAKCLLKWSLIAAVLLAAHGCTAWWSARRFAWEGVQTAAGPLKLDMTPVEWSRHEPQADPTIYLNVARNLAAGRGLVEQVPGSDPPRYEQFNRWGPGTPAVLGGWLWLTGGRTMWTFFWFSAVSQLLFGALAVATASIWTRSTLALATVAFCTGYCLPLRDFFYGTELTSAEIVALPITAAAIFALAKALKAYRDSPVGNALRGVPVLESAQGDRNATEGVPYSRNSRRSAWRKIALWFFAAGLLVGMASLCRDCLKVFAVFTATSLVARAALTDRRRLAATAGVAALLIAGVYAVRYPVQFWNRERTGRSVICLTSEGCIFRYGLWFQHDAQPWYDGPGIGYGEYLDPAAAERVEAYFQSGKPLADLYSVGELLWAIARRPVDALSFKAERLPVLWLAAERWPATQWREAQVWCVGMYGLLAVYCGWQLWRRQPIPEVLYLYLLLVVCATPLIHFEFRYTIPIWNTLVIAPGLLVASLISSARWCAGNITKPQARLLQLTTDNHQLTTTP